MISISVLQSQSFRNSQWLRRKESACQAGDVGLIPGSGRYPGEGNGSPLQYSCLENLKDKERVRYDLVTKQHQQPCFKALRYNIILL